MKTNARTHYDLGLDEKDKCGFDALSCFRPWDSSVSHFTITGRREHRFRLLTDLKGGE
jgi:hypothetical protein